MGIILSALGAAGDAGVQSMNQNIDQQSKLDAQQALSDLETSKAKTLADYQISLQNQQRQALVDRTSAAKDEILQDIQNPTDQDVADATVKAGIQNGDITPDQVMGNTSKMAIAQVKADQIAARTDMLGQIAQLKLDAAKEAKANGQVSASTMTMLLNSENQNIKSTTSLIGTLTRQLSDLTGAKSKDERADVLSQIQSYKSDLRNSQATKNMYLKQLGFNTSDDLPEDDTPDPSTPGAAPTPATAPAKPFNPADFQK